MVNQKYLCLLLLHKHRMNDLSLALDTNRNLIHRTVGWLQGKLGDGTLDHTSV